ncbi:probable ubiquitin-conjugating enzyme E2 24 isoform X3 [Abrus precatorius]|uniref:E2 ubiquitin-conjugating enzyme n=1 Tax=Abrus precatorius TaxID=3816 RepID=A0A8B8KWV6_ABRPR|nr:probable ubiquitin-conjugating enzyme E2 24 isoform X3 [Abrus precatorius]
MDPITSDSDWETSSDSSSSEDQEEIDFLYGGKAQSILSSLEESIGKIDDFLSFERAFVLGDVVCSLSDPSGQMGRVINVDVFVDLESVKGKKVFKNVNSKKLLKIRSISEGDYVIKGPWFGRIQRVVDKVTVLFDDGAKCDIIALEKEKILSLTRNFPEDSQYPYYPGQRVKVMSNASKSARWLCGTWSDNQDEGTVCDVEAGLVYVNWLASVLVGCNLNANAPQCWQDSKNLNVLSCFSHANWQLGDWCMLSVADQKEQIIQHMPKSDLTMEHCMTRGYERSNLNSYIGDLFIIGKIKTKVDIVWQNGECTLGLDPENLLPVNVMNNHEFWPHQFVLEKGASDDPLKPCSQRWGVVQCVDAKERIVKVEWKTVSISDPDNLDEDKMEETVSAYELVEHPDYSCFFGDIMFKAAQKQLGHQADKEKEKSVPNLNMEVAPKTRNQMSYQDEFPDNYFLNCIGNVTGFDDGYVEVKWATGFTTKASPNEIYRIDKHEGSTVTPAFYETNVEELTQEMIEHGSLPSDQKRKVKKGWVKKVQQEWSILEKNLPETIYVRVFEERMDLMRAAIVGASGTPYHDGVFFFDICFPPEYPTEPPMVHYNSGGLRLNPNLYESGKICLSLLNTWTGTGTEVWNPGASTILQVLLSLQALVLNEKPYFNEAGYDQQIGRAEGEKNSISYNENAFLVTTKSMLYLIRKPPKHFEALVEEHFRKRSQHILLACKAYLEGASIGCAFGCAKTEHENRKGTSTGFKIMLAKLFPKLVESFSDRGIDCSQFVDLQKQPFATKL